MNAQKKPFNGGYLMRSLLRGSEPDGALDPLDDLARRLLLERVVRRSFEDERPEGVLETLKSAVSARRWWGAAAAVVASVLVSVYLIDTGVRPPRPSDARSAAPSTAATGDDGPVDSTAVSLRTLRAAERPETRNLAAGVDVLLDPGTRAKVDVRAEALRIRLERGALFVDVDPKEKRPGMAVAVETKRGRVLVKGTVFWVKEEEGSAEVMVLEGVVQLTVDGVSVGQVAAGHRRRFGEAGAPVVEKEMKRAWETLVEHGIATDRARAALDPAGDSHEEPPRAPAPSVIDREEKLLSPAQLLKAARVAQRRHDLDAAEAALTKLTTHYPDAEETPVARLTLGRLYLEKRHDPRAALVQFDEYLRRQSHRTLRAEALFGKARAEQALADGAAACETYRRILKAYPDGPLAHAAKRQMAASFGEKTIEGGCPF